VSVSSVQRVDVNAMMLAEAREHESPFVHQARAVALKYNVEQRALIVRTLLHLPGVAGDNDRDDREWMAAELEERAAELWADQQKVRRLIPAGRFDLTHLRFVLYDAGEAEELFTHLHYLRSARTGALNFALLDPFNKVPVSLCSVSPLEWRLVGRQLTRQFEVPMEKVWDVSRVYSFEVAPKNAISYLLARVRSELRRRVPTAALLTTAVDPNLGFTGASYLAANWQQWMTVAPRPYLYVGGSYVSPRQLRSRFGTANLADIQKKFGVEVKQSNGQLLDSAIFCCRLRGKTEALPKSEQRRLRR
jgi:hypothetical protein